MLSRRTVFPAVVLVVAATTTLWLLWPTRGVYSRADGPATATPEATSDSTFNRPLFPRSFQNDGYGPIDIEPFMEEDRQPLSDQLRTELAAQNEAIECDPSDRGRLADALNLLLKYGHVALATPYFDRWRARGGELGVNDYVNHIQGLLTLARFEDATAVQGEFEKKYPGFPETVHSTVTIELYRCLHACRVKHDLVAATEAHMAMTWRYYYNSYSDSYQRTIEAIRSLIRESLKKGLLTAGALPSLDRLSDYRPASTVQDICRELEAAGISPSDSLRKAAGDPLPDLSAPASACLLRGEELWHDAAFEMALRCLWEGVRRARKAGDDRQLYAALRVASWYSLEHGDIETFCNAATEMASLAKRIGEAGRNRCTGEPGVGRTGNWPCRS